MATDRVTNNGLHATELIVQSQLACLYLGKVEDVIHQIEQVVG